MGIINQMFHKLATFDQFDNPRSSDTQFNFRSKAIENADAMLAADSLAVRVQVEEQQSFGWTMVYESYKPVAE